MARFEWGPVPSSVGQERVDARPGVVLSRRRFVELALYTSVGVILTGPAAAATYAVEPPVTEPLSTGPAACMPAVAGTEPAVEVVPYDKLGEMHLRHRADTAG